MESALKIKDLRIWVNLGCSEEEKFHPQAVSVDICVYFAGKQKFLASDDIKDAFCYKNCAEKIMDSIKGRPFNLIESLCTEIHRVTKNLLKESGFPDSKVKIKAKKLSTPVSGICGSVSFSCED